MTWLRGQTQVDGWEGWGLDAQQQQAPQGPDAAMEAAMLALIQERARKYEQDKAVSHLGCQGYCRLLALRTVGVTFQLGGGFRPSMGWAGGGAQHHAAMMTMRPSTAQHSTAQHSTAQHSTMRP